MNVAHAGLLEIRPEARFGGAGKVFACGEAGLVMICQTSPVATSATASSIVLVLTLETNIVFPQHVGQPWFRNSANTPPERAPHVAHNSVTSRLTTKPLQQSTTTCQPLTRRYQT